MVRLYLWFFNLYLVEKILKENSKNLPYFILFVLI